MDKVERFKKKLDENNIENFVVTKPPNIFYLLDNFSLSGYLFFLKNKTILVTSNFYKYAVENLPIETRIYSTKKRKKEILEGLKIEEKIFTDKSSAVEEKLKEVDVKESNLLEKMRRFKTNKELSRIKKACRVSTNAMRAFKKNMNPRETEWKLASVIDQVIRSSGCYNAFKTLVHSKVLEPHRILGNNKIGRGLVIVDLGAKYKGYCSDMSRTFCLDPTKKEKKLYEDVLDIYKKLLKEIKPGIKFSVISKLGEKIVEEKGYSVPDNYLHRAGHSLGINIHESPGFSVDDDREIKSGMVFTLEPGLYVPGIGGVRIEDTLHVKKGGEVEILTKFPKELET